MNSIYDYLEKAHGVKLTEQQKIPVESINGPILLLAVPGAGKTTVIVARNANLIYNYSVKPEEILTITFSKSSTIDMQERYEKLFGGLGKATPEFLTIHSFCYKVVRTYCKQTGGAIPALITSKQRTAVLRELYKSINGEFLTEDLEEELSSLLSSIKNAMYTEEEIKELDTEIKNLYKIYKDYDKFKKHNSLMDFDDMLGYALTVFRRYSDILESYRAHYNYICVDEAQDTSRLQHAVIRLLAAPKNNLFMVGDEDQSIYRFRGACPERLLEFERRYPGACILKMEENFRSVGNIVELTNKFIKFNKKRYPKEMFTAKLKGDNVLVPQLNTLSQQYEIVANICQKEGGSTAAIYRNNFSAVPLADILDRKNIDFFIKDQKVSFRKNYVVRDILSFFELSFDSNSFDAFSRIFFKTNCYIKRNLINKINTNSLLKGETYFDRLTDLEECRPNISRINYVSAMIIKLKNMAPAKAIDIIIHSFGYLDFLEHSSGSTFSQQVQKISVMQNLALRTKTVEEFLDRLQELDKIIAEHSTHKNARLTLTTAHSAKGLEFDSVVILDAVEGIFPTSSAIEKLKSVPSNQDEMEEEARLFYVACTRAKKHLVVPVMRFSDTSPIIPSRFIYRLSGSTKQ